jgi:hypothetical protein
MNYQTMNNNQEALLEVSAAHLTLAVSGQESRPQSI